MELTGFVRPRRNFMAENVTRDRVREEVSRGTPLLEVLPEKEYNTEHLPAAISLPLGDMNLESVARFNRDRPIIVYCYDER